MSSSQPRPDSPGRPGTRAGELDDPLHQSGRTLLTVLMCAAAAVGLVGGIVYLTQKGGADVESVALALLYAALPVPVLVGVYLWLDSYEPEPRRYLGSAFVWGAFGAVTIVLLVQVPIEKVWEPSMHTSAVYLAPLLEEPAKGVFLLFTLLRRRRVIDGMVDGFVYAGVAALGFAFTENVLYYTSAYMAASEVDIPGTLGATGTFFGRGLMTPFMHPIFTSLFGVGLAMATLARKPIARVVFPVIGIGAGMLAHGSWNAAASTGEPGLLLVAYVGMLTLLGGLITWAMIARRNEGRLLWEALTDMARRRGWLHVDEVPYLARLGLRSRARAYAKRASGDDAAHAVRRYQKLACETAFLYDGVMRGRPKYHAVERVDAMRAAMTLVRPRIVLPPPVRIVKRLPRAVRSPAWGYPPPAWHQPPPTTWQAPQQVTSPPYPPPPAPYRPPGPPRRR
ncbi:PrsW family intramembrane metalloprotease [Solicola gregarius]|uniref:PrsW family intramembrane metalloprotease n=1 Tax=Solicola gregarius TaxID=2908642 RepID=A0AA46TG61_9ACTN|nr:PrsW family intramembrane metalloprotease [Solicola gregarius]UYM04249.1 PrsW family intramembrane metalloprotease [Solicola gregarius]